jgi:hypothetical protein
VDKKVCPKANTIYFTSKDLEENTNLDESLEVK